MQYRRSNLRSVWRVRWAWGWAGPLGLGLGGEGPFLNTLPANDSPSLVISRFRLISPSLLIPPSLLISRSLCSNLTLFSNLSPSLLNPGLHVMSTGPWLGLGPWSWSWSWKPYHADGEGDDDDHENDHDHGDADDHDHGSWSWSCNCSWASMIMILIMIMRRWTALVSRPLEAPVGGRGGAPPPQIQACFGGRSHYTPPIASTGRGRGPCRTLDSYPKLTHSLTEVSQSSPGAPPNTSRASQSCSWTPKISFGNSDPDLLDQA